MSIYNLPMNEIPYLSTNFNQRITLVEKPEKSNLLNHQDENLRSVSILTSIIGILQIFLGGVLNSINNTAEYLSVDKTVEGKYLEYSGFLYFLGILIIFLNYRVARVVFPIANSIHIYILFRSYKALSKVHEFLNYQNSDTLPLELVKFKNNISLLQYFMGLFLILYTLHLLYLYKDKVVKYFNSK